MDRLTMQCRVQHAGTISPKRTAPVDTAACGKQGMEKAAIVLSLTVSRAGAFAADAQRLNVALTRARHHLLIVGAAPVAQVRLAHRRLGRPLLHLPLAAYFFLQSCKHAPCREAASNGVQSTATAVFNVHMHPRRSRQRCAHAWPQRARGRAAFSQLAGRCCCRVSRACSAARRPRQAARAQVQGAGVVQRSAALRAILWTWQRPLQELALQGMQRTAAQKRTGSRATGRAGWLRPRGGARPLPARAWTWRTRTWATVAAAMQRRPSTPVSIHRMPAWAPQTEMAMTQAATLHQHQLPGTSAGPCHPPAARQQQQHVLGTPVERQAACRVVLRGAAGAPAACRRLRRTRLGALAMRGRAAALRHPAVGTRRRLPRHIRPQRRPARWLHLPAWQARLPGRRALALRLPRALRAAPLPDDGRWSRAALATPTAGGGRTKLVTRVSRTCMRARTAAPSTRTWRWACWHQVAARAPAASILGSEPGIARPLQGIAC